MKSLIILLFALIPQVASAFHLASARAGLDLTTEKVTTITGEIGPKTEAEYFSSLINTSGMPGDRIILIDSPGGRVDVGQRIIDNMEREKAAGVRQICVVVGEASSMAFNILTHCDVRLATPKSFMVAHKIAIAELPWDRRGTAKNLRKLANLLEKEDEVYRQDNARAMHLPVTAYDRFADADAQWTAKQLYRMGYLKAIVNLL